MLTWQTYQVTLTTLEPFRIGGPEDPLSGEHLRVARVGSNIVVPGPTLKGKLRDALEEWLIDSYYKNGRWDDEELKPCIPSSFRGLSDDEKRLINTGKYRQGGNCHYPCKDDKCKPRHSICPVCYFLGANGLEGFVRVPFLKTEITPDRLYSARIDRALKTVAGEHNYPYELVAPETRFVGNLEVLRLDTRLQWQLGHTRNLAKSRGDQWLKNVNASVEQLISDYLINRLESIQFLGGYKSKGFGRVSIEVRPIKKK